jgi:hypothetical protein
MEVGGSGWWTAKDSVPLDHPARKMNLEIMKATPSRFAKLLGVPVIHAAQAGNFVGQSWPDQGDTYRLTTSVRLRSLMARAAFLRACLVKKALSRQTSCSV